MLIELLDDTACTSDLSEALRSLENALFGNILFITAKDIDGRLDHVAIQSLNVDYVDIIFEASLIL
jgi:hypothetical protein